MKKIALIFSILIISFSSCSKNKEEGQQGEIYTKMSALAKKYGINTDEIQLEWALPKYGRLIFTGLKDDRLWIGVYDTITI